MLAGTFLFPVPKPPSLAHALAAGGSGEELDERLDRGRVTERDEQVAADLDRARVGTGA